MTVSCDPVLSKVHRYSSSLVEYIGSRMSFSLSSLGEANHEEKRRLTGNVISTLGLTGWGEGLIVTERFTLCTYLGIALEIEAGMLPQLSGGGQSGGEWR